MSDEVIENINSLSSEHLWQRQVAAIKLGELGDLRAVTPLIEAFEKETYEEVKQAIEKALEEIAVKNGFDNAEQLRLVAKREDRKLEELQEITEENYAKYLAYKQINSPLECIGEKCFFYDPLPEKSDENPCALRYYFKYPTRRKQLFYSLALEISSQEILEVLKGFDSCQTGFMFLKEAVDTTVELEKKLNSNKKQTEILQWFLKALGIESGTWEKELKKWDAFRIKETMERMDKIHLRKEVKETINSGLNTYYEAFKNKRDLESKRNKLLEEIEELEKQVNQRSLLLLGLGFKKKQKQETRKQLIEKKKEYRKLETQINETKKEVKKATRPFREAQKILKKIIDKK